MTARRDDPRLDHFLSKLDRMVNEDRIDDPREVRVALDEAQATIRRLRDQRDRALVAGEQAVNQRDRLAEQVHRPVSERPWRVMADWDTVVGAFRTRGDAEYWRDRARAAHHPNAYVEPEWAPPRAAPAVDTAGLSRAFADPTVCHPPKSPAVDTAPSSGIAELLRRCEEVDRTTWRADGDPAGGGQISTAEVWRLLATGSNVDTARFESGLAEPTDVDTAAPDPYAPEWRDVSSLRAVVESADEAARYGPAMILHHLDVLAAPDSLPDAGDDQCRYCPNDVEYDKDGRYRHCIECGWTDNPATIPHLHDEFDEHRAAGEAVVHAAKRVLAVAAPDTGATNSLAALARAVQRWEALTRPTGTAQTDQQGGDA